VYRTPCPIISSLVKLDRCVFFLASWLQKADSVPQSHSDTGSRTRAASSILVNLPASKQGRYVC
jgi:hypothetical protein